MATRHTLLSLAAVMTLFAACGGKTQQFAAADGSVKASFNEKSGQWSISGPDGKAPVDQYDSMRVVEVSTDGHPMTVVYYHDNAQHWLQYYSTMKKRSEGMTVGGLREGHWVFYHPNGAIQAEGTFAGGREEGSYRVMRDNGAPVYIGHYTNGIPTGTWEFYDVRGNLVGTKTYDAEGNIVSSTSDN